jgi:hypothetical protein
VAADPPGRGTRRCTWSSPSGARQLSALETALRQAAADLTACHARFALVGGLAVSARAEPRFTRDIDLAVALDSDAEAEALVSDLMARGYRVLAQVEHESQGRLATARLALPERAETEGIVLDLLFASSGIEAALVETAEAVEVFPGIVVPVTRRPGLIATKILASEDRRPQDLVDARSLLERATPEEVDEARTLLRRVEQEGFHRGKQLLDELDALMGS